MEDTQLQKYKEDNQALQQTPYAAIGSVIGTHAGPGAVAVGFFAK